MGAPRARRGAEVAPRVSDGAPGPPAALGAESGAVSSATASAKCAAKEPFQSRIRTPRGRFTPVGFETAVFGPESF